MTRTEFSKAVRRDAAKRANGHCENCRARLTDGGYHYDHDLPDAMGGEATLDNCRVLCRGCHSLKTTTRDVPTIAKSNRVRDLAQGIRPAPKLRSRGFDKAAPQRSATRKLTRHSETETT